MSARWPAAPPPVATVGEFPPAPPAARVKVLHLITRLEAGAGGNTLLSAAGMDPVRYEVWIAASASSSLWERAEHARVRTVRIPELGREVSPFRDLVAFIRLVRLVRRERFAILHAHSAKGGLLGRLVGLVCRVPVVVYTLHGRDPWWPAPDGTTSTLKDAMPRGLRLFLFLERALRPATHRFVAVSPTVARDAVVSRIARPGAVAVAPSAVDLDAIPDDRDDRLRSELGIRPDARIVGTVGRLDAQKAPLDFVRMAAGVARRHPDVHFVVIGDGEQRGEAADLARRLGVEVCFAGFRQDAAKLASAFDVFVVTSLYEGVGRSVTEAMASGRPVVATAVDGVVDIVEPGATGLLTAPRSPDAMAERVCWLLDHPREARAMGIQARNFVRELFTAERMCATLDEVYSELLGLARAPSATNEVGRRLLQVIAQ